MKIPEVCKLLTVTPKTLRKMMDQHELLSLAKGGITVFPAFQFKQRAVLCGIPEVLNALAVETDSPLVALSFLLSSNPDIDNRTAVELLEAGEIGRVIAEARVFFKQGA